MIKEYTNYLVHVKRLSSGSIIRYIRNINQFLYFLEKNKININEINEQNLRNFIDSLTSIKARTVQNKLSAINQFLYFLVQKKIIKHNPLEFIKRPTSSYMPRKLFSIQEIQLLINIAKEDNHRDYLIILIMYTAGLRRDEVLNLKISSINRKEATLRIVGKGNKERIIPVHPVLMNAIVYYLSHRTYNKKTPHEYLLVTDSGNHISYQAIGRIVKKYANKAGLIGLTPHSLRHAFASHLLHRGANIIIVQSLLGHDDMVTTQRYTHFADSHLKKIILEKHPRLKNSPITGE